MQEFTGKRVRVFVIWEPVLPTDWTSPSTATLKRISDTRATQFWDRGRLISRSMGEHDREGIVWDYVAVYQSAVLWGDHPPHALYSGGPVVRVKNEVRAALGQALETNHVAVHWKGIDNALPQLRPHERITGP
jgi:hypothetical protein